MATKYRPSPSLWLNVTVSRPHARFLRTQFMNAFVRAVVGSLSSKVRAWITATMARVCVHQSTPQSSSERGSSPRSSSFPSCRRISAETRNCSQFWQEISPSALLEVITTSDRDMSLSRTAFHTTQAVTTLPFRKSRFPRVMTSYMNCCTGLEPKPCAPVKVHSTLEFSTRPSCSRAALNRRLLLIIIFATAAGPDRLRFRRLGASTRACPSVGPALARCSFSRSTHFINF